MWSFVGSKKNPKYIWGAIDRKTKQIVSFYIGDRSTSSGREMWKRLPDIYKKSYCYTDFYSAYQAFISQYELEQVGKDSGKTNSIERFWNSIRQRLARFVRKTLSFSKSEKMHNICLELFLYQYNLEVIS